MEVKFMGNFAGVKMFCVEGFEEAVDVSEMKDWVLIDGQDPEILKTTLDRLDFAEDVINCKRAAFREAIQEIFADWEGEKFDPERHILDLAYVRGADEIESLLLHTKAEKAIRKFNKFSQEGQFDQADGAINEFCEMAEKLDWM